MSHRRVETVSSTLRIDLSVRVPRRVRTPWNRLPSGKNIFVFRTEVTRLGHFGRRGLIDCSGEACAISRVRSVLNVDHPATCGLMGRNMFRDIEINNRVHVSGGDFSS